jgi:hypothetical protein
VANSARPRHVASVCLLVLVAVSCTESDTELIEDVGLTRLYPVDPDLGPQSIVSPGSRLQAVRWTIASAVLNVEGVEENTDLADGGCEVVAPSIDFPQFVGTCETGFVLHATNEVVEVRLTLEVTSMQVTRALPLYLAGPLAETVDYDGDGVLNDADGLGSAFDKPCGLVGQTNNCDDNCPLIGNSDQTDNDANGIGAACTTLDAFTGLSLRDSDADGVADGFDNCVWIYNPDQEDESGRLAGGEPVADGIGDACPEQVATVELDGQTSFTLELGPTVLLQPVGFATFITIDFGNEQALDCNWEAGSCVLDASAVGFCATLAETQAIGGCP